MIEWTAKAISDLTLDKLTALRDNASKKGRTDIVELCDVELRSRTPTKPERSRSRRKGLSHRNDDVKGFHFVCPGERGVIKNADGTLWTGTWVVAEAHAENAVKRGAYVALHVSRAEPSYIQGIVKDWRKSKRESSYAEGQRAKIEPGSIF